MLLPSPGETGGEEEEDEEEDSVTVHRLSTVGTLGFWFVLRTKRASTVAAAEVLLGGVDSPDTVVLSNDRAPYDSSSSSSSPSRGTRSAM